AKAGEGAQWEKEWQARFDRWAAAFPDLAREWALVVKGDLPSDWDAEVPTFAEGGDVATRMASGKVLNGLAHRIPHLLGGAADLAPSTETWLKGYPDIRPGDYAGRNLHFGVREHAMGSVTNGLVLHGLKAYCAGFLIFSSYMIPPIRYSSMMAIPTVFVYTHDSIGLGEDGPTHQPIESLVHLRSIPGNTVIRPADATETAAAWKLAVQRRIGEGPVCLIFSRQKLKVIDRQRYPAADNLRFGAYVLSDDDQAEVILIGTGSEVGLCMSAAEALRQKGRRVRVVSMPSCELFLRQPQSYQDQVLPPSTKARVTVEALTTLGWHRFAGPAGRCLGLDHYGASAPGDVLFREFGFTVENVVKLAEESMSKGEAR
ncbi:MAG TPA: transketolase C-terminal domain-containing protein, partial [Candidatus Xenobia bacterium]